MRLLFTIDTKDYDPQGRAFIRPSARCIAIHNGMVAMVYSKKYHYYKFPGGGIEQNEFPEDAVIREALEEAGLMIIPSSLQAYGYVHRVQKYDGLSADYFIQDNYYYLCDVAETVAGQRLDTYEAEEEFTLQWVHPKKAIDTNQKENHGPKDQNMLEREARVLIFLQQEGYFN